jgi:hypothetical protein
MIISNVHIIGEEGLKDISIEEGMINSVAAHQTKLLSPLYYPTTALLFRGSLTHTTILILIYFHQQVTASIIIIPSGQRMLMNIIKHPLRLF